MPNNTKSTNTGTTSTTTTPPAHSTVNVSNCGCLSDKDYLTEFLNTQKQLAANYNYYAGECVNTELRSTLLTLFDEEHDMQSDIFNQMNTRGWYQVKPAEQNEISTVKTKFPG